MNQSNFYIWFRRFYHLLKFGGLLFLILLSLIIGIMLIDDLNLASITIIVAVAILMVILFKKIR